MNGIFLESLMKIVFTLHALDKMSERAVDRVWVEETVLFPDVLKRDSHKYYAIKRIGTNSLKVVYVKESYIKIVTLYWR